MAQIKPFRAWRPRPDQFGDVSARPTMSFPATRRVRWLQKPTRSFLHVVKPEIDLEPGIDLYSDRYCQRGRRICKSSKTMVC